MSILFLILFLYPILAVSVFLYYLSGNSTNHSGFEFLLFLFPIAVCALIAAFIVIKRKICCFYIALIINVLGFCFFVAIDHLNIMVQYDRWTSRGMPEPFESSQQKKDDLSPEIYEYTRKINKKYNRGEMPQEEYDHAVEYINSEIDRIREKKYGKKKNDDMDSTK